MPKNILFYLFEHGFNPVVMKQSASVRGSINSHPDIFMCKMGVDPDAPLIKAEPSHVGWEYPQNIAYNAVCIDKYFIHNLKYTQPEVLEKARQMGKILIDVPQGYTKCSTVVVNGSSLITADEGIARVLSDYKDIDVLKISPGYVELPGYNTGFLGGASGLVGDTMLFCGDLAAHPDYYDILSFILRRGINVKFFDSLPLLDVGSFIESNF
jgi:hypothetical protein